MPTARPTMPSSLSEVSNTRSTPIFVLQAERHRMDAALGPDILAEHQHLGIGGQFLVEHAADGGDHVDPLALRLRFVGRAVEAQARRRRRPGSAAPSKKTWSVTRSGDETPRASASARAASTSCSTAGFDQAPVEVGRKGLQLRQRIARPFGLHRRLPTCRSACPGSYAPPAAARSGGSAPAPCAARTWAIASPISRAASAGSVPSPFQIARFVKLARLAAMSRPGV